MEAWIARDAAAALFAKAGLDPDRMYEAAKTPGFKAIPMPLKASADLVNRVGTINSRNGALDNASGTAAPPRARSITRRTRSFHRRTR